MLEQARICGSTRWEEEKEEQQQQQQRSEVETDERVLVVRAAEWEGRELADREEPGRNGVVNMDD